MKNKIILLLLVIVLPFLVKAQTMFVTKAATLTIDSTDVGLSPGTMLDILADTNWCNYRCVLKVTGFTINGIDSIILDGGGVGSVAHLWLSMDTLDTDFYGRVEVQEVFLEEVATDTTAKKGAWLPVNSTSAVRTITPPSNPRKNDWFGIIDSRGTSASNNITVDFSAASQNFSGGAVDDVIATNKYSYLYIYSGDATVGWLRH